MSESAELVININLLTRVNINKLDKNRCHQSCPHIEKKEGTYRCSLFDNYEVDTGEDDELGYGFKRHIKCLALGENKNGQNNKIQG